MAIIDSKLYFGAINIGDDGADRVNFLPVIAGEGGDTIDVGVAGKNGWGATLLDDVGAGNDIFFNIEVTTVIGGDDSYISLCGDETVTSSVLDAIDANVVLVDMLMASGLAVGTHLSQTLVAGAVGARYLQCMCGQAASTGIVEAWLSDSPADTKISQK